MTGLTLDASALIAIEKRRSGILRDLSSAIEVGLSICVPAGALAQVWRDGVRQVWLARLLDTDGVEVVPLDEDVAQRAGAMCGAAGTSDVVDASVVVCARDREHRILTSDADDMRRLDPRAQIVAI